MSKFLSVSTTAVFFVVLANFVPFARSAIAQDPRPAFVVVERIETKGSKTIQQEYAKLAREILPKSRRSISFLPKRLSEKLVRPC
jgi:hypothetical protein